MSKRGVSMNKRQRIAAHKRRMWQGIVVTFHVDVYDNGSEYIWGDVDGDPERPRAADSEQDRDEILAAVEAVMAQLKRAARRHLQEPK